MRQVLSIFSRLLLSLEQVCSSESSRRATCSQLLHGPPTRALATCRLEPFFAQGWPGTSGACGFPCPDEGASPRGGQGATPGRSCVHTSSCLLKVQERPAGEQGLPAGRPKSAASPNPGQQGRPQLGAGFVPQIWELRGLWPGLW